MPVIAVIDGWKVVGNFEEMDLGRDAILNRDLEFHSPNGSVILSLFGYKDGDIIIRVQSKISEVLEAISTSEVRSRSTINLDDQIQSYSSQDLRYLVEFLGVAFQAVYTHSSYKIPTAVKNLICDKL